MAPPPLTRLRPERFFVPPYVGKSGWVGVWLDRRPPWRELAELLDDAWRAIAPKRLAAGIAAVPTRSRARRTPTAGTRAR